MTRVLIDGRVIGHDGIGRYTASLVKALRQASPSDVDITVLPPSGTPRYSPGESAELARAVQAARADILHVLDFRIPLEPMSIPVIATVYDVLRLDPRYCYTNRQFVRRYGSDSLDGLRATVLTLRYRTADTRQPLERQPQEISLYAECYARMLAWSCQQAAFVVTPTNTVARQLLHSASKSTRVITIPLGVDQWTAEDGPLPSLLADHPFLLYVGQAKEHKGIASLIAAYKHSTAVALGARLACVGRDFAPEADAARQLADELGPAAIPLGAVPDAALRRLYAEAAALVHLSVHEGFGLTPLEAMAHGTRVIASNIPVLRETLGPHALLVQPGSEQDAAHAIDSVLCQADDEHAQAARIRWASRFTWQRHAESILHLYSHLNSR